MGELIIFAFGLYAFALYNAFAWCIGLYLHAKFHKGVQPHAGLGIIFVTFGYFVSFSIGIGALAYTGNVGFLVAVCGVTFLTYVLFREINRLS